MDIKDLTEQRHKPRFRTDFAAEITSGSGETVAARVTNLSLSGLQLSGDHRLTRTLMPNIRRDDQHIPIAISVCFTVPTTAAAEVPIDLRCKIVYCRRQGANTFNLGCNFDAFMGNGEAHLRDYIEHFGERL